MLPRAESFFEFLDIHLALEVATIRGTLLPRAESFLEFLDMTSVSLEPQSDLMRRPAMERIHTDPHQRWKGFILTLSLISCVV